MTRLEKKKLGAAWVAFNKWEWPKGMTVKVPGVEDRDAIRVAFAVVTALGGEEPGFELWAKEHGVPRPARKAKGRR